MSFILDALRRAERERRLERSPDLSAVYEESALSRGSRWPWLSAGLAFVVGGVVVALFLWPETSPPDLTTNKIPATQVTSRPPDKPDPLHDRPETTPAPPQEIAKPKEVGAVQPGVPARSEAVPRPATPPPKKEEAVAQPTTPPPKVEETVTPAKAASAKKPPAPAGRPPEPDTAKRKEVVAVKETTPSAPPKEMPEKKPDISPAPQPKAKEEPVEGVPFLKDLPEEVRKRLGKLEINVHGYSKDPAKRLVFINMRKYRVGDQIGKGRHGPVLKRIIPDGVIIDYGEGQARLTVKK